jgi:hypothetical protein
VADLLDAGSWVVSLFCGDAARSGVHGMCKLAARRALAEVLRD